MLPSLRFRLCVCLLVATLAVSLSTNTLSDAAPPATSEARWKNGELMAPLPTDAAARAAALSQARAYGASRAQRTPTATSVAHSDPPGVAYPERATGSVRGSAPAVTTNARWLEELQARLKPPAKPESNAGMPAVSIAASAAVEVAAAPAAMVPATTFQGIDDTGWDPGAPDIAVGPEHIVIATTDRFSVMDKCGNTLMTNLLGTYFAQPVSRTYYTPKVVYDPWTPRWIMIFIGTEGDFTNSVLYIAISDSADPMDGWYAYPIGNVQFPGLKDGPAVAVTPEQIYVTWNQFNLSTFAFERAVILELVKDDAYAAGAITLFNKVAMTNPNDATLAFSVQPAQMRTYAGDMYFVNSVPGGDNFLTLWELTGAPGASVLTGFDVAVPAYLPPPDMAQPNATLVDAGDSRMRDAVYSSGTVYIGYGRANGVNATVEARSIDIVTLTGNAVFLGAPSRFAYPAIDIDENDQITFAYCRTGDANFLGVGYNIFTLPFVHIEAGIVHNGSANFAAGSQPYRWGPYIGAALDPSDNRTVWMHGAYASNAPLNSWTTQVGAASGFAHADLNVEALTSTYISGLEGGPFSANQIDFELSNTGSTTANWNVSDMPSWLSIAETSGTLDPGASENISFFLNASADALPAGVYADGLAIANCTGTGGAIGSATLAIGVDGSCVGARVTLGAPTASAGSAASVAGTEVGAFVTAIEDVSICAIGIVATAAVAQDVQAIIYNATGTIRGGTWANSPVHTIVDGSDLALHIIPIDATLTACADYDIAVIFSNGFVWPYWTDPADGTAPFDAGRLVRVRDAEVNGSAADSRLPRIILFTDAASCENSTDLAAAGGPGIQFSADDARGLFINPERTMQLCSVGIDGAFVAGSQLTARLYKTSGAVRTALLAEGTLIATSPDFTFHDISISHVLLSGSQYDIEVEFEDSGAWRRYLAPPSVLPYTIGNIMTIYGAEAGGIVTGTIPHLRIGWSDDVPAVPFDLAKQSGPTPTPLASFASLSHGAFITSLIDQEVYSAGVMADIPDGGFLTASVYEASGTTRGALISTATMISHGGGMRWHDVPVSASMSALGEYDIQFSAPSVSEWPYWLDTTGLPYDAYGTIRVRDAEAGGVIGTGFLAHMRVHACNATATDVADGPVRVPMLLDPPAPNPSTGMVRFGYSVDEAGDVEVAVYDVAGKRVAQVARKRATKIGRDAVDFDTSKLASGVYFVKLTTKTKSTSRKFVVTH